MAIQPDCEVIDKGVRRCNPSTIGLLAYYLRRFRLFRTTIQVHLTDPVIQDARYGSDVHIAPTVGMRSGSVGGR